MASPPFNINQSLPGDSDIVSQHPANARTMRDVVESWLLINHNNLGQHTKVELPWAASPGTPGSSLAVVYADANGVVHVVDAVKDAEIGVPVGAVIFTGSSTLEPGYLLADGSAVSRSTFAALFAKISTTFGAGNGSTTFNLPNTTGRVIAGEDASGARLSATYFGATASLGGVSTGFTDHITLLTANLPPYTPAGSVSVLSTVTDVVRGSIITVSNGGGASFQAFQNGAAVTQQITSTGSIVGTAQGGVSTPFSIIQPTIILKAMIKY